MLLGDWDSFAFANNSLTFPLWIIVTKCSRGIQVCTHLSFFATSKNISFRTAPISLWTFHFQIDNLSRTGTSHSSFFVWSLTFISLLRNYLAEDLPTAGTLALIPLPICMRTSGCFSYRKRNRAPYILNIFLCFRCLVLRRLLVFEKASQRDMCIVNETRRNISPCVALLYTTVPWASIFCCGSYHFLCPNGMQG